MVAAMLASCASPHPASQVTVLVEADPHVRGAATRLVVRVTGGHTGETFLDASDPITRDAPLAWPFDVTVIPAGADATRLFEVEATAYDSGQQLVSQARLRGGYVRGESRRVTLTLEDACLGISCGTGLTCHDGHCVTIGTHEDDAGVNDAALDAGPTHCTSHAQCDDDNLCNGFETCVAGACVAGTRLDCDDHVSCTNDSCDGHQCQHTPDATHCTASGGGTCDPTNDCQYPTCDTTTCRSSGCQMASCSGATCIRHFQCDTGQTCCGSACVPAGCADALPCTTDYCGASGTCQHDIHTGPCDDRDMCTGDGTCATDGSCAPGPALPCDDTNSCTTDVCDPATGCHSTPNAAACSDDDMCTVNDSCGGGTCLPGVPNTCDDMVACTDDTCNRTTGCRHVPNDSHCTGPGAHCDPVNGCQTTGVPCNTTTNCVPTNACETTACAADGVTCQRSPACSASQSCCGGVCVTAGCNDGNPCTDDMCVGGACRNAGATRGCDDGNACTMGDTCVGTSCVGTPITCEDFNECTDDACGTDGSCTHSDNAAPCDPGNPCASSGVCAFGHCMPADICPGQSCCGGFCMPRQECGGF